ncbi:MAG: MlaE family lipid ABC transporter permease subunit [Verrucomicrobia bacterium]|nr:MlaE family lipid ABC transporter permease subunit [Verrucomicrobiota bacterium]
MTSKVEAAKAATAEISLRDGTLAVRLGGWLDAQTLAPLWVRTVRSVSEPALRRLEVDASAVDYCDGAGIALIVELRRQAVERKLAVDVRGLKPEFQVLLDEFVVEAMTEVRVDKPTPKALPEEVGRAANQVWRDMSALVQFIGELAVALFLAARHPGKVRWRDALLAAENAGVNALPIVALISFLMGLIMAFQSAVPMRQFGVEIFVADLVALSMLRELGPLMTAIILAGRSGSAFAAEIGTMKVNEEINALTTMGLDPVRFLVVTRVIAAVTMMPLLTIFANLMGLVGGSVVLLSMDYPLVTYVQEVLGAVQLKDLFSGMAKAIVFGVLVAGIGCLRGLQTKTGASAVGLSTTSAVVSGIVLIVLADGVFSVVFYYLKI